MGTDGAALGVCLVQVYSQRLATDDHAVGVLGLRRGNQSINHIAQHKVRIAVQRIAISTSAHTDAMINIALRL